ncbi:NAD-dependent epimerase/dehydratase family protein (plasmid) [Deinococcus sp. KNUC1210]|uniref:NAD-dependent epimerase/dehydratase family protein n=1 Tax=Deinococcus sp. KNUC1210 TaxID=2917691 RepID=UPI001EEF8DA6|nr:NAD-dependent epimerase/dehydratase family protein [Deinococcus sp. KNUC1210]ULH17664.1 NAD-dependent epimerase/dehydratase family protein [Deinococcus sp. KNUC1210]
MRVVVIGGTGHIGTFLVPRLLALGCDVVSVSRQQREPYQHFPSWKAARQVNIDRSAAEAAGEFGQVIVALKPDVVIDLICFTPESSRQLTEALRGQIQHFLHCGTIWVHGHSTEVPTQESVARRPFGAYGTAKAAIEQDLLHAARQQNFPATVLHPGHIVGPGWVPLNPAGHFNPEVFTALARGEELSLPNLGLETVHHVHADDVAQGFERALTHWNSAVGEAFHLVSPAALTLRGYAEAVSRWFGHEANLSFLPFAAWRAGVAEKDAQATWEHISRSPNCSIGKARQALEYAPRYSSLEAVQTSLAALIAQGVVTP